MIKYFKGCKRFIYFASFLLENNKNFINYSSFVVFKNFYSQPRPLNFFQSKGLLVANDRSQLIISRNKSKGKRKVYGSNADEESSDEEEDGFFSDDDEDENYPLEKGCEIKIVDLSSLRTDLILKALLKVSRKNVEEHFYENKIRINGNIIQKKSENVAEGDEIDLIKNVKNFQEDTLNVGRIKILRVKLDSKKDKFYVKAWVCKSLVINNYPDENKWRENEEAN